MGSLGEEIKQKQFKSEFQKAAINLAYTASRINQATNAVLRDCELTIPQFNILRILRGADKEVLSVKELTARMIDQSSNASRLVDKLVKKNWVERKSCPNDRRKVEVKITAQGLQQVLHASEVLEPFSYSIFSKLDISEAQTLNNLLDKLRK